MSDYVTRTPSLTKTIRTRSCVVIRTKSWLNPQCLVCVNIGRTCNYCDANALSLEPDE